MKIILNIWRQRNAKSAGKMARYEVADASEHMSFLEMLDVLNEELTRKGEDPVTFEHDCREGICGCCGFMIDGVPHGPQRGTTVCQLHMRHYKNGDELWLEPFRAKAFPVLKDLMVDRSAFDRVIASGGFISVNTGSAPDGNALPVVKKCSDMAMDAAACIGCGACVASCPNASASLFVSAKISHLGLLPQGQAERDRRAMRMVMKMTEEGFGYCTNAGECEAVCPKGIKIENIARMHRDYLKSAFTYREESQAGGAG
ncbi:MAG: succinate dehydrogenase/fumarate reductase iron-sulfur subunit [Candidatus Solibacter usitatus]|nr:succinate dehydrogenase/fumarate reductase iron-sulfur subunit [Candidatus Solibacter usitatus]